MRATRYGLLGDVVADANALAGLHEDPDRPVGHLEHPRDEAGDADRVQVVGAGLLELGVARGDEHELALAGEDVVDELDRALLADGERRQRVGVGDDVAQREHGQRAGQRLVLADGLLEITGVDDLNRHRRHPSIGTRVVACAARSGSSTRRMPSS